MELVKEDLPAPTPPMNVNFFHSTFFGWCVVQNLSKYLFKFLDKETSLSTGLAKDIRNTTAGNEKIFNKTKIFKHYAHPSD